MSHKMSYLRSETNSEVSSICVTLRSFWDTYETSMYQVCHRSDLILMSEMDSNEMT